MPAQPLEPADQALVAATGLRVVGVDAEPRGDGVEGSEEFARREVRQAVRPRPLVAYRFGRMEARGVIDDGAAAEAVALEDEHREVVGREEAARVVHPRQRVALE